jgi:hypothetical protein
LLRRQAEPPGGHEGAKVGGEPFWIQRDERVEGSFLAALGRPAMLKPAALPRGWERTRASDASDRANEFAPGDGGLFNFFHAGKGKVDFTFQCY